MNLAETKFQYVRDQLRKHGSETVLISDDNALRIFKSIPSKVLCHVRIHNEVGKIRTALRLYENYFQYIGINEDGAYIDSERHDYDELEHMGYELIVDYIMEEDD